MKHTKGKSGSGGRWSSPGSSAQVREPIQVVEPTTPSPPQSLLERLPTLSDTELTALLVNAQRVSAETANRKAATAAELIPLILAEKERRGVAKAEAGVVRKKDMASKRATVKARRLATTAAENAAKEEAAAERDDEE